MWYVRSKHKNLVLHLVLIDGVTVGTVERNISEKTGIRNYFIRFCVFEQNEKSGVCVYNDALTNLKDVFYLQ